MIMLKQVFLGMLTGYLFLSLGIVQVSDKSGTIDNATQQIGW